MIDLHYFPTPNGWKVTIALEECGLEYRCIPVDIRLGEQFQPDFLRVSPNNKIPAIVDHDPIGGGEPLSLFESGAILEYLADKSGKLLAREGPERYRALQWVHWQMANLGPMVGNAVHFKAYAPLLVDDPKQLEYAEKRYTGEVDRLCGVMDAQLKVNAHLAGDDYTIADVASWGWVKVIGMVFGDDVWGEFPHLHRWLETLAKRPAVEAGSEKHSDWARALSDEEEAQRRKALFNQSDDKVRGLREAAAGASRTA